ncbi:KRI1-like family C-terminal-domain-containing protein [Umbelopsis sp. AD052]|nr:KRI1-like family C-terminal-domain-containing protein [Umbelopsis sp. AD052]
MDLNGDDETFDFKINEEFAKKYEHNKQREELGKLKDKYGDVAVQDFDGDRLRRIAERKAKWGIRDDKDQSAVFYDSEEEESTDEEEDENAELLTPEVDAQIMKTIAAIRTKDPQVYDSKKAFFVGEEIEKAKKIWEEKQKQTGKKVTLKDYHRGVLLEDGGIIDEDDEAPAPKTHVQEQEEMKSDFKRAIMADEEEEDGFFTMRDKTSDDLAAEEEDYKRFLLESMADNKAGKDAFADWQNYRENPNVDKDEAFLIDYVLNRGWVDKDANKVPSYNEVVDEEAGSDADEEYLDKVDRFESAYNFRFEEEGGTHLVSHARDIDGSVRKKDNRRKLQRQARLGRKDEEKLQKDEELKRLKNLKMKEIEERLKMIQDITGNSVAGIDKIDLTGDFDGDAYDSQMKTIFDDSFYTGDDNEKPTWDDDIDTGLEETGEPDGQPAEEYNDDGDEDHEYPINTNQDEDDLMMDADYLPGGEKYAIADEGSGKGKKSKKDKKKDKKKKGKMIEEEVIESVSEPIAESKKSTKRAMEKYMEEYYNLNYEDMIGDLPTRFKYRKVDANNFGLSPVEILLADDKDLNQVAGLKVLAPFRPAEKQASDKARFEKSKKFKLREFRKKLKDRQWK